MKIDKFGEATFSGAEIIAMNKWLQENPQRSNLSMEEAVELAASEGVVVLEAEAQEKKKSKKS